MTAMMSWMLTVLAIVMLVLTLNHLGVNAVATVGSMLHGTEHLLGEPLSAL